MTRKFLCVLAAVALLATLSVAMAATGALNGLAISAHQLDAASLLSAGGMIGALSMVGKVAYTNEGRSFLHVGSVTIPPGETRDVDPSLLPDYQPAAAAPGTPMEDPIAVLLKGKVAEVIAALPALADEDLTRAEAMEQEAKAPRKSLLEAFAAELLRRADLAAGGKQE